MERSRSRSFADFSDFAVFSDAVFSDAAFLDAAFLDEEGGEPSVR
jgi:hypothetical protein